MKTVYNCVLKDIYLQKQFYLIRKVRDLTQKLMTVTKLLLRRDVYVCTHVGIYTLMKVNIAIIRKPAGKTFLESRYPDLITPPETLSREEKLISRVKF